MKRGTSGAIEPLYNALGRSERRGGPRAIVTRHERGAAFMADGYARQTGKLAVCCATTDSGSTNLITGVSSAYENHIPMLVITAQTSLVNFGRGAFQESSCTGINTVGMFQYCTRYNTLVSHLQQFERKLSSAVLTAFQSPSGPAHLSVPLDVLRSPSPVKNPSYDLSGLINRPSLLDHDAVDALCRQLETARKVVFVVGDECNEAIGVVLEVAVMLRAAIVSLPHGKGLVSPYHPLFRGVVGFAGHASAHEALTDPNDAAIIAGIVALAKSLRLITVAEGVETFEQHKYLHDLQCDLMQGCYLSEPLAASVFEDRLLNSPPQLPAVNTDNVAHLQGRIRRRQ